MENSTKKSVGVVIPKKKRSLDLKSLYESQPSEVGGCKKNDSGENEQEDVKKKKRKNRKEVSLSSFESDAKKRKKDDENGTKSELGFREKLDEWSKDLHGISLALGDNGSSFNIPKRPRGSVGRKKLESNQGSDASRLSNSVDRVGSFKADVKSEDKGGPSDQLFKPVTFSARKDNISKSRLAGKVIGPNAGSMRKADAKYTVNSTSSSVKPKKKVGADEVVDHVGASKPEVTKFEDKGDSTEQLVRPVTLSAGNVVTGKVTGFKKKPKPKVDPKSTTISCSSNVKLKKKVRADEDVLRVGAEVTKPEDKGGPNDQPVMPVTLSSGNHVARKVFDLNKKPKWKADLKHTMNSDSSNVKLKKVVADEAIGVTKSEDKGGPKYQPVMPVTLSSGNHVARKVFDLNKKPKWKAYPKHTMNSDSSNVKLKKKVVADEAIEVTKSEDKGGPNEQSVKPVTLSSGNHVARKVFDLNKKPKWKADPKHTVNSDSSNVKLKKKVVADEAIEVTKSEYKGGLNKQSIMPITFSACTNVVGKVVAFHKKSKQKGDPKSTMSSSCSSVKLKNKVEAFEAEVTKSEDKGGPNDQSVRSVTPSAANDVGGKVVALNKNSKRKGDPKPTMKSASSNLKLKKKVGAEEAVDRVVVFETEVTNFAYKGGPNNHSISSVTLSAGNNATGKVVGSKKKPKQKEDPKSTMVSSSSNVIPKKKVGADDAIDHVGAFDAEVTKGGPKDQSVRSVTISAGNDVAGKVVDLNKKPKRKAEPKSTMNSSSSIAKLKKVGADEAIDRVGAFAAEITKSEDKSGPNEQSVRSVAPFTDNGEAGIVIGLSKKSKRKVDSTSTMFPSSSNKKLKKMGADGAVVQVEAFKAEVSTPEDKGGPIEESVRPATLSLGEDGDGVSHSRLAGKVIGSNTKSKQKAHAKSNMNSSSSNSKLKQKVAADEVKAKTDGQSDSFRHVVEESNPVVDNGVAPSEKRPSNSRKKKGLVVSGDGVEASIRKPKPAVASPVSNIPFIDSLDDDDDDDDEENLERNAARMLSSRFDPSCTGFSSKRKSSVSQTGDELSFPVSSARDSTNRQGNSLGCGGESGSGDDNSRGLRTGGGDKGNVMSKKRRRHFYEIPRGDLDPSWVLNRRIKIFWPLDESWYFGHVTDYHSEAKLHHLKYDDGEEEWVNLEEENFRLLLHRSEVPSKCKSRKRSIVIRDTRAKETIPPADDDSCVKIDPDSDSIASWLASQPRRVKAVSKSSKRRKMVSSLSSVKTENSNGNADASKPTGKGPVCESTSADKTRVSGTVVNASPLRNGKHAVYFRKRYSKKSSGISSVCRGAEARGTDVTVSLPTTKGDMFGYGCVEGSDKQLLSFDDKGELTLNDLLLESKKIRIQICVPLLPYLEFSRGVGFSQLLHDIFMLQHGVIMTTSPAVFLKMFVIDSNLGLRSIVFEGCLMGALAIVFLILTVFSHCDEQCSGKMKLPVTSIRFQLSSVHDQRKQRAFAFYSFSRLERSRWVYLESKILQQCRLIKQLSVSECTYGNVQELSGILQPCKTRAGSELFQNEDFRKKFERGILPMGVSEEAMIRMSQSAFSPTGKPGNGPQFTLSFSAASNMFLGLHLQSLMKQGSYGADLQNEDPLSLPEISENGGEPIIEHENRQSELGAVLASNATKNNNSSDKLQKGLSSDQQVGMSFARKGCVSRQISDASLNVNDGFVHNSNTVGSKSSSKRRRSSTISSLLGNLSPVSADSQPNFMRDGFSNGPKKPRTQVQYSLPLAGYDPSAKQEVSSPRSIPCKRIRRASLKKISDGLGNNQKNLELQICFSNVLVTHGEKGWRECGANIVLEFSDHNEWRLAVKISGETKFSYKVTHILQPGSTNRYSHAVIWKGGKDWVLEFPDRSQWVLFKEMYEECYNRNIRAASVKNIPIPGVRLVEENNDYGDEIPFVRHSIMYFRQVQTDAEMAMNPSHILYDMDSDDEQWLMTHKNCTDNDVDEEISEEFFEMAMDMFEKVSYAQRRDYLTDAEIEETAIVIGSVEAARVIYLHWQQKREKMRMPLIRHLQPPPWQRYQKQVKEWERSAAQSSQEKLPLPEKPPIFAFCFKPRGLDIPNKSSKQRSHRRLSVSGPHLASPGDHSHLVSGRRSNRHAYGDEKSLYASNIYNSFDVSASLRPSTRMSSRDAHFALSASVSEWKVNNNDNCNSSHKKKPKKKLQRTTKGDTKNGAQPWNMGPSKQSGPSQYYLDGPRTRGWSKSPECSYLQEYNVRSVLGASQRAQAIAKLKRERAQKMFCEADLAMNKAAILVMQAEAIKDPSEKNGVVN